MPMLPLHVDWCPPLPIPSSKNHATCPKTHKLPYLETHDPPATLPQNSTKTHKPHATLPNKMHL